MDISDEEINNLVMIVVEQTACPLLWHWEN